MDFQKFRFFLRHPKIWLELQPKYWQTRAAIKRLLLTVLPDSWRRSLIKLRRRWKLSTISRVGSAEPMPALQTKAIPQSNAREFLSASSDRHLPDQTLLGNIFDQYQNMMLIARCIRETARQCNLAAPRVLELSRYPTNLLEYVPEAVITRSATHDDKEQPLLALPVSLPFADRSFDVCLVTDAYEHIPAEMRPGLLREMMRVSNGIALAGSPVNSEIVNRIDRLVFDLVWCKYGYAFEPIRQHAQYGLDTLEEIIASLKAQGAEKVVALPCHFIYRMIHQILLFFDLQYENPLGTEHYEKINRIYNQYVSPYDYREPCYKYFMVTATSPLIDVDEFEQRLKAEPETPLNLAEAEGALVTAFREANNRATDELSQRLKEINELRHELWLRDEEIVRLKMQHSKPSGLTSALRKAGNLLSAGLSSPDSSASASAPSVTNNDHQVVGETDYQQKLAAESQKWGQHLRVEATDEWHAWLDHPVIREHYRQRGLIDGLRWEQWVQTALAGLADRSLELGCGAGKKSLELYHFGSTRLVEGIDLSPERIAEAERRRTAASVNGGFRVADVNQAQLPQKHYDLIFSSHSFHHFLELEHILQQVHDALTSQGLFILEEFVGPTQFQWTPQQMNEVSKLLATLPPRLRVFRWGAIKEIEGRPTPAEVVAASPFESIRSGEILPLFEKYFDLVTVRRLGGTIQHLLYNGIAHHFSENDEEAMQHLRHIISVEDRLIDEGKLPSDFMLLVGKRKDAPRQKPHRAVSSVSRVSAPGEKTSRGALMKDAMQYRTLGHSQEKLSALGLGCMGMSQSYGERDDAESTATLERALALGINFFDTADIYGEGHNEELVGRFVRQHRHSVFLATKFGFVTEAGKLRINGRPDYVRRACEASLRRLGVDVIDLFYLHRLDPQTPIEETVGAMADLVQAGKVRLLGLSEVSAATLRRAHHVHPISALQSEYSLWSREVEAEILPACHALGVSFVPFSPLSRGFLTGQIDHIEGLREKDARRNLPRFQGENFQRNLSLAQRMKNFAAEKNYRPAQLALAWILAQGDNMLPIPGTKRRAYLEENCAAVRIELTSEDIERLNQIFPPGIAAGERYNADGMKFLDR